MSLESQLQDLARDLRDEDVPYFYVEDLTKLADQVGDLEWRMLRLED